MGRTFLALSAAAALALGGCTSARINRVVVARTLDPTAVRRSFLEATLRVLDDHPDYVDEMFVIARRHPRTLERFTANFSRALRDPPLATMTAQHLADNPAGLRQVLIRTMDASRDRPAARAAIARAIEERADLSSAIIADRPSAVRATQRGAVRALAGRPQAREAFLAGMRENREAIARLLVDDPETLRALSAALVEAGADDLADTLRARLRAMGRDRRRGGGPR